MNAEQRARELPEMPTPAIVHVNEPRHFYTAKQMREYARQAITRALTRPAPTEAEVEAAAVLDAVIREMDTDEKGKPYVYTKPSMVIWTDKWRGWVARLRMARAALGVGQP